jgi:hypothetical protein
MSTLAKGTEGVGNPASMPAQVQQEDALVVAKRVFGDFELDDIELQRASEILWTFSGGAEYRKIMTRAMKKPQAPWDSVDRSRREGCIVSAMSFHCSSADMEKMALRTGAGLILVNEGSLGRKIIEICPASSFGVQPVDKSMWFRVFQICAYVFMFAIIGLQSLLSGNMIFVVPAIIAMAVGILAVWLVERSHLKLKQEEGEARHYVSALGRLSQGALPKDIFEPDGSLRSSPQ